MNHVDEQSGERCHKRHKFARPHLSRKTSANDNLVDMMKAALAWSDTKMSYLEYQKSSHPKSWKIDETFEAEMEQYFDLEGEESREIFSQDLTCDDCHSDNEEAGEDMDSSSDSDDDDDDV